MTLVEMKRRYGRTLLNAMERFSVVIGRADRSVACCISVTHPVAEVFHRSLCIECGGPIAVCPLFSSDAITGIVTAKVIADLLSECPLTAHLQRAFGDGSKTRRSVFWCADDAFEIADLKAAQAGDGPNINTGWRGRA